MTQHKVIYDTDPGVDDAMALFFLQASPEVELVGITTTFGNGDIETTTRNALYLCERFGIDVPVAKGHPQPLVGEAPEPARHVHGANGLGDIALPGAVTRTVDPRPAARFIIDQVKAHPGEISIVAVGRMTNLALALREAPEIAGLVRQVVIMGGAFGLPARGNATPCAEANIFGDALAADEVCAAAWPLCMVGLDVTLKTLMPTEELKLLAEEGGEVGSFIWDITRFYERFYHSVGHPALAVHDSSAVAYLIAPELFTTRSGPIRVVTEGIALGETIQRPDGRVYRPNAWDGRPSHLICTDVDSAAVLALYRRTLLAWTR